MNKEKTLLKLKQEIEEVREKLGVEFAEVKHGRWIFDVCNHREHMKCSECLHSYEPTGVFTYCPNCGAKMD